MATLNPTTPEAAARRAASRDRSIRICEALGLDPNQTSALSIDVAPGGALSANWSGFRVLDDATRERVAAILGEANHFAAGDPEGLGQ